MDPITCLDCSPKPKNILNIRELERENPPKFAKSLRQKNFLPRGEVGYPQKTGIVGPKNYFKPFVAVKDSSIGDLVTQWDAFKNY